MKKKVFLVLTASFIFAVGPIAFAQTITLTGNTPATLVYGGQDVDNWIVGSFTITCTATSNTATTTDIAPQQETWDRNNFTYINTGEIIQIDNTEIYKSKQIGSTPVKMWGVDTSVSSSNFYLKTFSSGTHSQTFNYYFWFNNGFTLSAGTYQLPITIRTRKEAYSTKGPKTNPVAELPINLTFVVDPAATLAFRSSSGGAAITAVDFGDLSQAVPQSFVVNVNSNFRYSMNVSSLNGGNLVSGTYQIPYTMSLNGTQVPLTSAGTRALNYQPPNTGLGTDYNVTLAVVLPQVLEVGSYSDSLTFTITAQ